MSKDIISKFKTDVEELIKHLRNPEDTYHVDIVQQCDKLISNALLLNQSEYLSLLKTELKLYACSNSSHEPYNINFYIFRIVKKYPKAFNDEERDYYASLLELSFYQQYTIEMKGQKSYSSDIYDMADELSRYYHRKKDKDKVLFVLSTSADYLEHCAIYMPAMRTAIVSHQLVNLAKSVACKEMRERFSIIMEKNGLHVKSEMGLFSESFFIPSNKIAELYRACSANDDPGVNYFMFGILFIPTDSILEKIEILVNKPDLSHMVTQIKFNTNGNIASIAYPGEKNENLRKILSYTKLTELLSHYIHFIVNRGKEEGLFNEPDIINYLANSPLLNPARLIILKKGINAYLENDYITSISVFIPQIEEMIRNTYRCLGYSVTTSDATKTESDSLGYLLKKETVSIGERNVSQYLDYVLSDSRGWNLRNLFCHGLTEDYNWKNADRLFQILMLLAGLRFVPDENN